MYKPKTGRAANLALLFGVAAGAWFFGIAVGRQFDANLRCCQLPPYRNLAVSVKETLGLESFPSEVGQDRWVSEGVFPGVRDGYFLDVGSGDGIEHSNTFALEQKGWKGICIDPFPTHMERRTCQMFKQVVYSASGKRVTFRMAGEMGGVETNLWWKDTADKLPAVEFTTVTLRDILDRAQAPPFIYFMSLDIEGAELEALRGLPFDRYKFGAMAIEHNYDGIKRTEILQLLASHGYTRAFTWSRDDFYLPADSVPKR